MALLKENPRNPVNRPSFLMRGMAIANILSSGNANSIAGKEEDNHVVDNLCDSVGTVVGWAGIELHTGWIYSFVAGDRPDHPDN
jgi:hypothetical protein